MEQVIYCALSVILGLLPEATFFTISIIFIKNMQDKYKRLFFGIFISYIILSISLGYNVWLNIGIIIITSILIWILQKRIDITDIFIVSILAMYMSVISYICFILMKQNLLNYYICFIINRILMFVPLIFRKKFNTLYLKYIKFWNKSSSSERRPIKSITTRNISVIVLNCFVFLLNIAIISIINLIN